MLTTPPRVHPLSLLQVKSPALSDDAIRHVAKGEKGRWWSITKSFGDILRVRLTINEFFIYMSTGGTTMAALHGEVAPWLLNEKVITDITFIQDFCKGFWNPHMKWAQTVDPIQKLQEATRDRIPGFRAPRMPRRVILMHKQLLDLEERGLDHPAFAATKAQAASFDIGADFAKMQVTSFLGTARRVLEAKAQPWLRSLVDCSLGDHPKIAKHMALQLGAIYDGTAPPVVPADTVTIEGEDFFLPETIANMAQFVTPESLREDSMLFSNPEVAEAIKRCSELHDFDLSAAGADGALVILEIKTKVFSCPIQSHACEAAVQEVGLYNGRYSKGRGEHVVNQLHFGRANFTRKEMCDAFDVYQKHGCV